MPGKFYVAVAAFMEKNGKLLILKRSSHHDYDPGKWETVSGRLEQHSKDVKNELKREIKEELGDDFNCKIIAPFGTYHFYRDKGKAKEHVGIDYIARYISGKIKLSKEHTEYRWINPQDFVNYKSSSSLQDKVRLFIKVNKWFLRNSSIFQNYT